MGSKYVVALSSSPRRKGNSRILAEAVLEGAAEAGHRTELVHLADHVTGLLRNCRECRKPDGTCSIGDGFDDVFFNKMLKADGLVVATPIWWYGMSAHLKNFFDRMFCYFAASYPQSAEVVHAQIYRKHLAIVLSAEENNLSARLGALTSLLELSRYLHWTMTGVVTGIGNTTGEASNDPLNPLAEARALGRRMFDVVETDYKGDTPRSPRVWADDNRSLPTSWR
ncbi:MAG: flavodoxin family protein [Hyphomicrobium sp.]|uniref:flavodoxin family protein n=1 Tax=Hyphomicrobium sp. TaxID=82 RepID=UPI003D0E2063